MSDAIHQKLDNILGRLGRIEGKVDSLEGKVDSLEGKVDSLRGDFDSFRKLTTDNFATVTEALDALSRQGGDGDAPSRLASAG